MRITKLELHGFKSFPDKTVLHFGAGISCVVGPNGCGKSNVVDAVKWCMGEQSARSLRGGEMLDVIFAGSTDRAPVGFAEVCMTFSAEEGEPFPGDYARFDAIEVSRRLHRSGASEYSINKTRCRRRDIVELFLDTGVGNNLYSFIEQGSIGKIVHARPAERRSVIDEAAGISRYKARREEAQGRLEQTATQLDRAADVEDEMARRLRQLEKAVIKAARFRRLRALLRQREIVLALAKYADLAEERRRLRRELRVGRDTLAAAERDFSRRESDVVERREELDVVEHAAGTWRDELAEVEANIRENEGIRSFSERRLAELASETDAANAELAAASTEAQAAETEVEAAAEGLDELRAQRDHAAELEQQASQQQATAEATVVTARAALEAADRAVSAGNREVATVEAQLMAIERREADGPRVREAIEAELAEIERELARARQSAVSAAGAFEALSHEVSAAQAAVADADTARIAASRALSQADAAARQTVADAEIQAEAAVDAVRASIESLDGLTAQLAALDAEIQASRARGEGAGALAEAVPEARPLAELLELDEEAADRLSAVLGDRLMLPVVDSEDAVLRAAAAVREAGSAQLLWLARPGAASLEGEGPGPGMAQRLLDQRHQVDTLKDALAHHRFTGGSAVVRDSGERVDADGTVHLGDATAAAAEALRRQRRRQALRDERKQRIDALGGEPAEVLKQVRDARRTQVAQARAAGQQARQAAAGALEAANEGLASARAAQAELSVEQVRRRGARDVAQAAVARLERRVQQLHQRIDGLAGADQALVAERKAAQEALDTATELQRERSGHQDVCRAALRDAEAAARDRLQATSQARVEAVALRERATAAMSAVSAATRRQADATQRAERATRRLHEHATQREGLTAELARLREAHGELAVAQQAATDKLEREKARVNKLREAWRKAEEGLREVVTARDTAAADVSRIEGEVQQVQIGVEGLRSRMDERYQVSLPGLLDRLDARRTITIDSDPLVRDSIQVGGKVVDGVPDMEVTTYLLGDFDRVALMVQETEDLRQRLSGLGEVNLAALEEYKDVAGRHQELVSQRADLEESVTRIRAAIAKMNRLCRQRFRDAFDRVNEYFQELYPRLVGGGSARLSLTDEDDLLETGVDIFVQPPGKRLQNLTLLSGGEKAMTAIALILSLFQVKPSPFCLLDEVDAPLDEGNGARFNDILREMSSLSQFIVVTHNRKTMECADTLYGITMPTAGVSRMVSVRIGSEVG